MQCGVQLAGSLAFKARDGCHHQSLRIDSANWFVCAFTWQLKAVDDE